MSPSFHVIRAAYAGSTSGPAMLGQLERVWRSVETEKQHLEV